MACRSLASGLVPDGFCPLSPWALASVRWQQPLCMTSMPLRVYVSYLECLKLAFYRGLHIISVAGTVAARYVPLAETPTLSIPEG